MTDRAWGVKCLTDVGWVGGARPTRYSEAEAKGRAAAMNEDPAEKDTWEARRLDKPTGGRR